MEAVVFFINKVVEATQIILEEEEEEEVSSQPRNRNPHIERDRESANQRLIVDYFADEPLYSEAIFRRRFRMSRRLFLRIADDLPAYHPFFTMRPDARGKMGFTTLQKCTASIRQLAYGTTADSWDEYLKMAERTARECLYKFCKFVVKLYSQKYLRKPNHNDVQNLYQHHQARHGFPGMLGSIDCMHWSWRNCPTAWRGMYTRGDQGHPTIILEVVASQDLWIWHAFFGIPGSNNNINVLQNSEVFDDVIKGVDPDTSFTVSGVEYRRGHPADEKRKKFAKFQEAARKDIERCFGVLQQRWHIIENPARAFTPKTLRYCMYACILLHNMILEEDEGHAICEYDENAVEENNVPVSGEQQDLNRFSLHNDFTHVNLQSDLIDHIWSLGENNV
ncbi:uncharacterized protein LOC110880744 [Helianthus annuus]|uniref:uncharacterized protein LOC110880744 n=1 Tax=Helianthus annuus TaxID=4232 RepID=UPI000B8FBF3C|nr:uncharacterized protein LOC110880744 [Helianthus annuus]